MCSSDTIGRALQRIFRVAEFHEKGDTEQEILDIANENLWLSHITQKDLFHEASSYNNFNPIQYLLYINKLESK